MKKVHGDFLGASQQNVPTNQQIQRLLDVEELLNDQDGALGVAVAKYDAKEAEIKTIKEEVDNSTGRFCLFTLPLEGFEL